ncbi:tripartite motif-containing protein 16-like isoform X7 [Erpetoichthys calabaricus]|uniref:tripartite motif-containing protein 16-like isoform X7 n=1 Tax=Erpetoichthys calabaricus TaxID=27687 RepID=UPI0022347394|nr:tripartite motif-containing protein 16-like isoform X7 [Erpetoichthys calabaricus]
MAESRLLAFEDELICSLCLDTLTDLVSLHCGHSFCLKCLTDCWDHSQVYCCPQCKRTFTTRPELHVKTGLSEVVKKLKKVELCPPPPPAQNYVGPGDVECDACIEKKFRAVKSCLTCMASFCQTHLQPHVEEDAWKGHKLVDPDANLKEKLCAKHQKSFEIFCKTDETCICMMCVVTGHNGHKMVELEMEREEKQKQLGVTMSEIRMKLVEKEKTLEETRRAMEQMKISWKREVEKNEKSFADLIHCMKETRRKVIERIREQEKKEVEKAQGVLKQLEKDMEELKRRDAELKKFAEIKDNVQFLKNFSSCCVLPDDGDSLSFTATADFSFENLRKELSCLKKSLEKISQQDIMTWTPSGYEAPIFSLQPPEHRSREEFLQYFCPLTLDINTAHRLLRLSEGNKKVTCKKTKTKHPDHPDRFQCWAQVLCRETLAGTRCYWEVDWSGDITAIGVAYKGISRKGEECRLGHNDKSWSLWWSYLKCFVCHNDEQSVISAPYSPRVGVYLDWPAGSLSFYNVSHTMTLLHRFDTSFTEPLCPGFYLGPDSSVTICNLTPGDH